MNNYDSQNIAQITLKTADQINPSDTTRSGKMSYAGIDWMTPNARGPPTTNNESATRKSRVALTSQYTTTGMMEFETEAPRSRSESLGSTHPSPRVEENSSDDEEGRDIGHGRIKNVPNVHRKDETTNGN